MFQYVPTQYATIFFIVCLVILAIISFVCLIRAIIGPRATDRVMAANMIGTKTILMVCILSIVLSESYVVDIALVYAMLSFLAVVVLAKMILMRHASKQIKAQKEQERLLKPEIKEELKHD